MEDKLMKLTNLTILLIGFMLLVSLASPEGKSINKDNFMRINPNITNEALRAELENLMKEFDLEQQRVRSTYDEKIESLKEDRRLEIKSIKREFGEARKALFIKYGEDRNKPKPTKNPNKVKWEKGKKQLRKSK